MGTTTFLQDVRKVKWKSINHAYGTSENIRTALVKLWNISQNIEAIKSEEDAKKCNHKFRKSLDVVEGFLHHQGTIYESTIEAIPFLIKLIPRFPFHQQKEIIFLLHNFSKGQTYYMQHESFFNNWRSYTEEEYQELVVEEKKVIEKMYWVFDQYINDLLFFWDKLDNENNQDANYGNLLGIILLLVANLVERNPKSAVSFESWFKKAKQSKIWNLKNTSKEITTVRCYVLEMLKKTSPHLPSHFSLLQEKALQIAKYPNHLEQEKIISLCALLYLNSYTTQFDEIILPLVENVATIERGFEDDFLYLSIYISFDKYIALSLAKLPTIYKSNNLFE